MRSIATSGRWTRSLTTIWERSPIRYVKNARTPTLIVFGQRERAGPADPGVRAVRGPEGPRSRGQARDLPREGHGMLERQHQVDYLRRVVEWFETHLASSTD